MVTFRVAAVKEFEDYFFDQRPRISPELIQVLFHGEDEMVCLQLIDMIGFLTIPLCVGIAPLQPTPSFDGLVYVCVSLCFCCQSGLVPTCGNFNYSQVASRASLDLLCRLLDVEKNKGNYSKLLGVCVCVCLMNWIRSLFCLS